MSQIVKIETAVRKQSKGGKPFWAITSGADKYTLWENSWRGTQINVGATLHAEVEVSPDGKYKTLKPLGEMPRNQQAAPTQRVVSATTQTDELLRQILTELRWFRGRMTTKYENVGTVLAPPHTDKDLALPEEVADDLF